MPDSLIEYIQKNFPGFWSDVHIRFELGEPFDNGTDERIKQVVIRATTLFEDVFDRDDTIQLFIKDYEEPYTDDYIYQLLSLQKPEEAMMPEYADIIDTRNANNDEYAFRATVIKGTLSTLPYKALLQGIANLEQGRKPSIGQQVYFVCVEKNIMFYMYDDRGCIIFAVEGDQLIYLSAKFNQWLVGS